jgi:hypothetical protein
MVPSSRPPQSEGAVGCTWPPSCNVQTWNVQAASGGHARPQSVQLALSLPGSTQRPPQHMPSAVALNGQAVP